MKYLILRWTGEEWIILHYSHNWDDVERMYEVFKAKYGEVSVFLDARIVDFHDGMVKARELAKKLREKKSNAT